jgi:glycosyltransferase involved in cell wall biosynthesis
VSVGRLTWQKGHDVLLKAWPAVRGEAPDATLAIVGDGPERGSLASSLPPGVTLAGDVANARDWVSAADVVVLPSRWEGMSLAMLEAMAASRAVVITAVAGSEVVAKAEAGAVVPVGNDRELAAAVARRLTGGADNDVEGRRGAAHVARFNDRVGCFLRLSAYIGRAHVFGVPAGRE